MNSIVDPMLRIRVNSQNKSWKFSLTESWKGLGRQTIEKNIKAIEARDNSPDLLRVIVSSQVFGIPGFTRLYDDLTVTTDEAKLLHDLDTDHLSLYYDVWTNKISVGTSDPTMTELGSDDKKETTPVAAVEQKNGSPVDSDLTDSTKRPKVTLTNSEDEFEKKMAQSFGYYLKLDNTVFWVGTDLNVVVSEDQTINDLELLDELRYHRLGRNGYILATNGKIIPFKLSTKTKDIFQGAIKRLLRNHDEDDRIIFLDTKRKAKSDLNVAIKPKKTTPSTAEVINVGSDLENEENGRDEEGIDASIYHTASKFYATITPFNKTSSAWNQMHSFLTGPPKKHHDYKEFNRMHTVANQRFRDVQDLPENLRLWGILGKALRGRTKNSPMVVQISVFLLQQQMNGEFDKTTMDTARVYLEKAHVKTDYIRGINNPFKSAQGWEGN